MKKAIAPLLLMLPLLSCSDYKLRAIVESNPDIYVTPEEINFGNLNAGHETSNDIISITNVGNDELTINDIFITSSGAPYSLVSPETSLTVFPGETIEAEVTYSPYTFSSDTTSVFIQSDDPDEPLVEVPISGFGDAPIIEIDPDYHDFGKILLGCDEYLNIEISNIGNANLEITDLEYFATVPVDFELEEYEVSYGPLPWTIIPGDSVTVGTYYIPLDTLDDSAYIEVTSNDPANGVVSSAHDGLGEYDRFVTDLFDQDENLASDILFVVDNSGSMGSNQTQLSNNFDTFINVFSTSGVDYHIAFITTDSSEFAGDIITPSTPDPVGEAMSQITSIGYHGSAYERGMDQSWNATMGTGDAAPGSVFLRDDSKLVVIYISDEDDYSTVSPSGMEARLLSLKSSPGLVVAHAVAGDVPGGCTANGGAQAGTDYHTLVTAMGGTFLSICAEDWGTPMEELARDSLMVSSFTLSEEPIEDTIEVLVDGVINYDWTYDQSVNAVSFAVIPGEGSSIDITYAVWAECNIE